jgi:transcriptional regulator with PAS, ATPase and Fis domain
MRGPAHRLVYPFAAAGEILRVAPMTTPVLIRGETGTGKEPIVRAHGGTSSSTRARPPRILRH